MNSILSLLTLYHPIYVLLVDYLSYQSTSGLIHIGYTCQPFAEHRYYYEKDLCRSQWSRLCGEYIQIVEYQPGISLAG
jgi:hypothetical protein